ncbi:hypothetical protein HD554DRAFT_2117743 [Boletus coccyginus]|nr:hypothetical protein HD554DRAFT_2117743 [Boletus coccyginus]
MRLSLAVFFVLSAALYVSAVAIPDVKREVRLHPLMPLVSVQPPRVQALLDRSSGGSGAPDSKRNGDVPGGGPDS